MPYLIEKGVPIPQYTPGRRFVYPFDQMAVGESFLVEEAKKLSAKKAASHYGKTRGKRFMARTTPEGVRIWRVA